MMSTDTSLPKKPERIRDHLLMAFKALSLAKDLSAADRLVAAALLIHFDERIGGSEPSIARLAEMLKVHEKTVRRATKSLCEEHLLFAKESHRGRNHCARYTPIWQKFKTILIPWERYSERCEAIRYLEAALLSDFGGDD